VTNPEKAILKLISESDHRIPADEIYQHFRKPGGYRRRELRAAIRRLLDCGELSYSYELGQSFLERSFNRPIQVTSRITLAPPGHAAGADHSGITIRLAPGAAFGYGQHPTTRMALAAIDQALEVKPASDANRQNYVLDLGTGSGVLVIAAVKLGMSAGLGLDRDPCALAEAQKNVALNALAANIQIKNMPLDAIPDQYGLITANLRLPTLIEYRDSIIPGLLPEGMLILSGIKSDEQTKLRDYYSRLEMKVLRHWNEKGWATLLMQKRVGLPV